MAATPADIEELLAVDVLLVTRERQDAIVRESVASGGCLIARAGDGLAAFVTWDFGFFNRPFVRLLVVGRSYRRQGLGCELLQAVERAAAPNGEIFVSTEQINAPMRALLASLRYIPSGSIENINGPGNAELVYYKRLDSARASSIPSA